MSGISAAGPRASGPRRLSFGSAARQQATVASGQLAAGAGNLGFTLALARLLPVGEFAIVAAYLALYLLVHVPARSLSAATTLAPAEIGPARRRALAIGVAVSAAVLAAGLPLAASLGLPALIVALLAAEPPLACLLAVERGRLYGTGRNGQVVVTLLLEPGVRLSAGVALALAFGAPGAAAGITLGTAAAAVVATAAPLPGWTRRRRLSAAEPRPHSGGQEADERRTLAAPRLAVGSFLVIALVQSADVVFGNARLPPAEAGEFAALSTLGGAAAFATTTVPFVLMPQAQARQRGAFGAALLAAIGLGGAAVAVGAILPESLIELLFGTRFAAIAGLAAPYLLAMALLGVGRVLAAQALATGAAKTTLAIVVAIAPIHLALLAAIGNSVHGLATATLASTALLATALGGAEVARRRRRRVTPPKRPPAPAPAPAPPAPGRTSRPRRLRTALALGVVTTLALAIRLVANRSLWLDEATSWYQSQLPFAQMLADLQSTDVHPPLHHSVLWLTTRLVGDGELALRAPSLLAGMALIPLLFLAGRALYDRRTGLLAAGLGAVAPLLIWYSQEARMYSLVALFAVIALWSLARAIATLRARYWVVYSLAGAALFWTHYFAGLPVIALQLALAAIAWRRRREPGRGGLALGLLVSTVAIAALVLPLLPFAADQFSANQAAGKGFDEPQRAGGEATADHELSLYAGISNLIWAVWGYHDAPTMVALVALWPLLILLALLVLGRGRSRSTALVIAGAALPPLAITALSVFQPFLFEPRFWFASVPFVVLLAARAIARWPGSRVGRYAVAGLVAATFLAGAADQELNGTNPRLYDFRGALSEIESRAGPRDLLLYEPPFLNNVVQYYSPELEAVRLRRALPGEAGQGEPAAVETARRVFVLGSFRGDPAHVGAARDGVATLERDRELVDRFEVPAVKVWELR